MSSFFMDTRGENPGDFKYRTGSGAPVDFTLGAFRLLLKIQKVDFFKISPNGKSVFDNLRDFILQMFLKVLNNEEKSGERNSETHRCLKITEVWNFKSITGVNTSHSLRIEIPIEILKEIKPSDVDEADFIGEFLRKNVYMVVGYHKEGDNIIIDLVAHCRQLSHHVFKFMPSNKIQDSLGAPGRKYLRETKEGIDLRFRLGHKSNDVSKDTGRSPRRRGRSRSPRRRGRSRSPHRRGRSRSPHRQDLHGHIGGGYPPDSGGPAAVPSGYIRVDQVPAYMSQFAPPPQPPPHPVYYPWGAPPAPGV